MIATTASELQADMTFYQEWQRIVFQPDGERVKNLDSGWYDDENVARSMLNEEYPGPTSTGWVMRLQTRWVSEHRMVAEARKD